MPRDAFEKIKAGLEEAIDLVRNATDGEILTAFNRGRIPDSEIDRENAVEISGGDPRQLDDLED